jgi:hypothetical protein
MTKLYLIFLFKILILLNISSILNAAAKADPPVAKSATSTENTKDAPSNNTPADTTPELEPPMIEGGGLVPAGEGEKKTAPIANPPIIYVDPTTNMYTDPNGPDLKLLWNCKYNPKLNQEKCLETIFHFCMGRCSRLNCAILTNRAICLDLCGVHNPNMQPCIEAGQTDPTIKEIPLGNANDPNMQQWMGIDPSLAMMGLGAGAALLGGGLAIKGLTGLGKKIGSGVKAIGHKIGSTAKAVGQKITSAPKAIGHKISSTAKATGNKITSTAKESGKKIKKAFSFKKKRKLRF